MEEAEEEFAQLAGLPTWADRLRAVTEGGDDECAFVGEGTLFETQPTSRARVGAEGDAAGEDPVEPSLEDRRHAVPPQRKLDDERICPAQLVLLTGDLRRQGAGEKGLAGVTTDSEALGRRMPPMCIYLRICCPVRGVMVVPAVAGPDDGIPAHRVEIRLDDRVAASAQMRNAVGAQTAAEGSRFGKGADPENSGGGVISLHASIVTAYGSCV